MLPYCLNYRKKTKSKNLSFKTEERKTNAFIKMYSVKQSKFVKEQETSETIGSSTKCFNKVPFIDSNLF